METTSRFFLLILIILSILSKIMLSKFSLSLKNNKGNSERINESLNRLKENYEAIDLAIKQSSSTNS